MVVAEMSSEGNLITADYSQRTVQMIQAHKDIVFGLLTPPCFLPCFLPCLLATRCLSGRWLLGYIAQEGLGDDPAMITMTPGENSEGGMKHRGTTPTLILFWLSGVKLHPGTDSLGQVYNTPMR